MKRIVELLGLIKPYKTQVFWHFLFSSLTAIFTVVSIPAIIPFFNILFDKQIVIPPAPVAKGNFMDIFARFKYEVIVWMAEQNREQLIVWFAGALIILFFLKNVFRYLSLYTLVPVRMNVVRDMREAIFNKMISLPMRFFTEERKGHLISRITTDVLEVEWSVLSTFEALIKNPLLIIGSIGFMMYISPKLILFVLFLMLITVVVIGSISKNLKKESSLVQKKLAELLSIIEESLGGVKIIKSFSAESYVSEKFQQINIEHRNINIKTLRRRDLSSPITEFLGITIVAILMWYGAALVFNSELEPGTFLAFIYAFYNIIEPAKAISTAYYSIQKGLGAYERIEEILNTEDTMLESPNAIVKQQFEKNIVFEKVHFKYPNSEYEAISNFNVVIQKGETIAIVGASGSGKSTLTDLLCRFQDPSSGSISIDGVDLRDMSTKSIRSLIAVVNQEAVLFNDTIENNIRFGNTTDTLQAVQHAAEVAFADSFIKANEEQYQSMVGDRGVKLSGGQRQRITIARAILKDAPILILDEATSALDSESERVVQQSMEQLFLHKTAIVIAHRLSTIQKADRIIVMREGKIVEMGSHDSLVAKNGEYAKFVALQRFEEMSKP